MKDRETDTIADMELSCRSWNGLCNMFGSDILVSNLLDWDRPQQLKNFGECSFSEVIGELLHYYRGSEIRGSVLWRTSPRTWRKRAERANPSIVENIIHRYTSEEINGFRENLMGMYDKPTIVVDEFGCRAYPSYEDAISDYQLGTRDKTVP